MRQPRNPLCRARAARLVVGACALAAIAAPGRASAQPAGEPKIAGAFKLEGTLTGAGRTEPVEATLTVKRNADGTFSAIRSGRYTRPRHPSGGVAVAWEGTGKLAGRTLAVEMRVPAGETTGVTGVLGGNRGTVDDNVFKATYVLSDDDRSLEETVVNTKKLPPEEGWDSIKTKGFRTDAVFRVKLGGSTTVLGDTVDVIVPTDGTLTLTTTKGTIVHLLAPGGGVAAPGSGSTCVLDLKKGGALGRYQVKLAGAQTGTISAVFVQNGRIDGKIRPWSSHTWYPLYEFSHGESKNDATLYVKDGPLDKMDRALGLTGRESAVWWEKGTDYRTGFGLERGHYTRISSPTEANAELDWFADLNGDGVIGGKSDEIFVKLDLDKDGKATRAEVDAYAREQVLEQFFREYDTNNDGKIGRGEINDKFLEKYGTAMIVDRNAWRAALERDFKDAIGTPIKTAADAIWKNAKSGATELVAADLPSAGAVDFMDANDVDEDWKTFFDRDNVKVTLADGKVVFGNRVEEGPRVKLWKGYRQDVLAGEYDRAQVKQIERGVADGELTGSYSMGWWGHCNAWSMAAIIFRRPEKDVTTNGVTLSVRDQKGILVELAMGDTENASFGWAPTPTGEIGAKRYTAGFHQQLKRWLREGQQGLMADMDLKDPQRNKNFAVWNYPLIGYEATMSEAAGDDPQVIEAKVTIEKGSYSDEDHSSTASLTYVLHFDGSGGVREDDASKTDWTTKKNIDGEERRAYVRYLIHPVRLTGRGSSGNPNVTLERVEKAFNGTLRYNTPDGNAPGR